MGKIHRYKNVQERVSGFPLDKTLEELKRFVNDCIELYGEDAYVAEAEYDYEEYVGSIYINREESDKELAKRQKAHDKILKEKVKYKEKRKENEIKMLKYLNKKHPDVTSS